MNNPIVPAAARPVVPLGWIAVGFALGNFLGVWWQYLASSEAEE